MGNLPDNELKALMRLVEDDEEQNAKVLKDELSAVASAEPERFETLAAGQYPATTPPFISTLLEDIRWRQIGNRLQNLPMDAEGELNLEEGLYLISRFNTPQLSPENLASPLDEMAASVKARLEDALDLNHFTRIMGEVVFKAHNFHGASAQLFNPSQIYLHDVLTLKSGSPISLSAIYVLLGKRLGIPIVGVGLPGHFIVRIKTWNGEMFLDPHRSGRTLSVRECQAMVFGRGMQWDPQYLKPVNNRYILSRTIGNLIYIYNHTRDERRSAFLKSYFEALQEKQEKTTP